MSTPEKYPNMQPVRPDHSEELLNRAEDRLPEDWHATIKQPVFVIEDSFFRARTSSPVHWSIAWSDLMMTMFILFLTLFIYQMAHRQFLDQERIEVVGGTTVPVTPSANPSEIVPFYPISPQLPINNKRPLRAVEKMGEREIAADDRLKDLDIPIKKTSPPATQPSAPIDESTAQQIFIGQTVVQEKFPTDEPDNILPPPEPESTETYQEVITNIYDLSRITLEQEKLERFASVELIPDKAMRIVLTGDLLFASGKAKLNTKARESLYKLAKFITQTPYMINVVGHTDSVPMYSEQFPSNWELSVARASTVARFLIEEMGIPARQVVVSGFSYFRPLRPNDTEQNRSKNRRVEIILSKEPPPPQQS